MPLPLYSSSYILIRRWVVSCTLEFPGFMCRFVAYAYTPWLCCQDKRTIALLRFATHLFFHTMHIAHVGILCLLLSNRKTTGKLDFFFLLFFSRHNHTQHGDTLTCISNWYLFRNYQKCYVVVSTITSLIAYVSIFAYACLFDMLFFFSSVCILLSSCQTIFSTTSRCNAWKAAKVLCTRMGMFVYLVVTTLVAWKPTKAKQSTQRVYVQCIAARVKKRDKAQRNRNKLRRERENARSSTIRTKQRTRLRFWVEKNAFRSAHLTLNVNLLIRFFLSRYLFLYPSTVCLEQFFFGYIPTMLPMRDFCHKLTNISTHTHIQTQTQAHFHRIDLRYTDFKEHTHLIYPWLNISQHVDFFA